MTTIKTLALTMVVALTLSVTPLAADLFLENWQFEDTNGTQLNSVANTGTQNTSFNFGGPRTQNGNLNIGDPDFFKWDAGSGNTFRTAQFASALTSGQHVFEYNIADWNLGGTDSTGVTNNGIRFNIGSAGAEAQLRFEVSQNVLDIRGRSTGSGTVLGTAAQYQFGGNDVVTANSALTLQLNTDLDTGDWSARARIDNTGVWTDLTTDGTGMFSIDRLQLVVQGGTNGWEYGGVGGTSTEYVKVSYATLSAVPEPTSFTLFGLVSMGLIAQRRRRS